jgi:predicted PurR-regulated permease PerM
MRSSDITLSIFIILVFAGLYFYNILAVGIKKVQDNWPEYRCNPMVMPFAGTFGHDAGQNFTFCIQNMQADYMGVLLQPLNYLTSVLNNTMGGLMTSVQSIRSFINEIRNSITSIVQSIFGVFLNILIQFQFIIVKIKDMMGKIVGIMASMMYILQGTVMTMQSSWNGPPGQMVRFMGKLKI